MAVTDLEVQVVGTRVYNSDALVLPRTSMVMESLRKNLQAVGVDRHRCGAVRLLSPRDSEEPYIKRLREVEDLVREVPRAPT